MKTYNVDEDFIKEAYNSACPTWKEKIKDKFPYAFTKVLEVGKWYKRPHNKALFCITSLPNKENHLFNIYGFDNTGCWMNFSQPKTTKDCEFLATSQEVETALIQEAKKRGYTQNNFNSLIKVESNNFNGWYFNPILNTLYSAFEGHGGKVVFKDGVWATIIKQTEVTQQDLENFYKESKGIDNLKVI